ncbi:autotransporter-associated beta strand repeat-containing protein [Ruficoccus amylovorans]|uniref:Autotransporter-associated beta strand repeat-containing protein n=1 Tax=Ruficoccus amylovorans TaxID=1804625 RepID=A0A842HIL6_9BACT|nr:autotransporter-associated beta strand repeat-containing protein [Ruficoccus amylovorans]MBC2595990.1 autotransporter-associated beta strand repeat-containing protein [Ruficoccus amylovorans]
MKKKLSLALALSAGLALVTQAETYTFIKTANTNWLTSNNGNWDPDGVPGAGDTVMTSATTTTAYNINLVSEVTTIENLIVDPAWKITATKNGEISAKTFNVTDTFTKSGSGDMIFTSGSGTLALNIDTVVFNSAALASGASQNSVFFGYNQSDAQALSSLNISNGLTLHGSGAGLGNSSVFLNVEGETNLGELTYDGVTTGYNQFVYLIASMGGEAKDRTINVKGINTASIGQMRASAFAPTSGTNTATLVIDTDAGKTYSAYLQAADGVGGVMKLVKRGEGTQVLTFHSSTYSGGTEVQGGLLNAVVSATSGNTPLGSGDVLLTGGNLQVNIRNGEDLITNKVITRSADSYYGLIRAAGQSFAGYSLTSDLTGGIATTAELIDGTASATRNIKGSFRSASDPQLLSDILTLTGSGADTFVLQFIINGAGTDNFLVYWNGTSWVKAVSVTGGTPTFVEGAYDPGEHYALGTYGVDSETGEVWAVIDYDGEFAVSAIPEAASAWILGSLAVLAVLVYRRRMTATGRN